MGVVPPEPGFLEGVARLAAQRQVLLIFDEVITGFRLCYGGAQTLYGIRPDLTCLGKIIGGGLPIGAFGGRREIMALLAPEGPVYQAGTLSGNPLSVAAGVATLRALRQPRVYERLEELSAKLEAGLREALTKTGVRGCVNRVGSMLTLFFGADSVRSARDAERCDAKQYGRFFRGMIERGVYFPPAQFEAAFVSLAHSEGDIDLTVTAAAQCLAELAP